MFQDLEKATARANDLDDECDRLHNEVRTRLRELDTARVSV